jgi:hypothetical protein
MWLDGADVVVGLECIAMHVVSRRTKSGEMASLATAILEGIVLHKVTTRRKKEFIHVL